MINRVLKYFLLAEFLTLVSTIVSMHTMKEYARKQLQNILEQEEDDQRLKLVKILLDEIQKNVEIKDRGNGTIVLSADLVCNARLSKG